MNVVNILKTAVNFCYTFVLASVLFAANPFTAKAQLSGTKLIASSGGDYTSIANAITALNTSGVGSGGVIFNVGPASSTAYTETITAPLSITRSGTSANPIVFRKNPASTATADPLITSYNGTLTSASTTTVDGMWRLIGTDYITIDAIDLFDKTANNTNTLAMEYGYALYKASATDGCQNVIIRNCTITLNRVNFTAPSNAATFAPGSTGILVSSSAFGSVNTVLTPTSAAGANSNNDFYGNIIQNCNTGIALIGYAAPSPFTLADQNNDVGGTSAATGNSILNYGGGASATTQAAAVTTIAQYGLNVSYNTINSNNGSGVNHPSDLKGVYLGAATSASSTVSFNTISVKGVGTTQIVAGVENLSGSTAASNTVTINNNTISGTYTTSTTGLCGGIFNNAATPATLTVNNNTLAGFTSSRQNNGTYGIVSNGAVGTFNAVGNTLSGYVITNAAGVFYGIRNQSAVTTAINFNSNNFGNGSTPVTYTTAANTLAQYTISNEAGGASCALSITNNSFYSPTYSVAGSGSFSHIFNSASTLSQAINTNTFYGGSVNTTGDFTFISNTATLAATGAQNINSNVTSGTFTKSGSGGNIYLYNGTAGGSSASGAIINHNGNNFSNLVFSGTTVMQGWAVTDAGAGTYTAQNNVFNNWQSTSTGNLTAFNLNITSNNNSITANQISNFTGAGNITGITTSAGNDNIFVNNIYSLTSSSTTAICTAVSVTGGTTQEVYRNKIYDIDNSSATTTAGAVNGILIAGGTAVNIYNNLIGDLKTPAGAGTDIIRGISITSATASSTINVYYNTVHLNTTSSAGTFGSSAIFHTASATTGTAVLDLRNNIISNTSTPKGTALTVAFRRSAATLVNYATTSNNNLFYAGTPSSTLVIYNDASNSYQTLANYKSFVANRDQVSVTEDLRTKFLATTGSSASFLHIDNILTTAVGNAGATISGYTTDYDGQTRGASPDIGADEILYTNGWLGVTSTDWNTASNWDGGIPASDSDVDIPSGKTFYPVLTSGTYSVHNINTRSGATVTLTGGTFQISGGIVTGGTFTASNATGTIEFNGTQAQTIPAAVFAGNIIDNLKTNNTAGITLNGTLSITDVLTPTAGAFNANGNLTLVSSLVTASPIQIRTALIDGSGGGTVTGNVTMQRYLASGFGYKYFSSPMQSATVNAFSGVVTLGATFPNFYRYDETSVNTGFTNYSTATNPLNVFAGYAVNFGNQTTAKTVSITGVVNNGTQSVTLYNNNKTFTKGFNLVGNPYPSPINWIASGWTKTNIDDAIYLFDSDATDQYSGSYSAFVNNVASTSTAGSDVAITSTIASMQGFFIHVSDPVSPATYPVTATLTATNAVRTTDQTAYFRKSNSVKTTAASRALVRVTAGFANDAKSADPFVIYTDNAATKKFNGQLDAVKLLNINEETPNFFITGPDSLRLVIQALPKIDSATVIPLSIRIKKAGTVEFKGVTAENLPDGLKPYLYDASIRRNFPLGVGQSRSVKLSSGNYDQRFYLKFADTEVEVPINSDNFFIYRKDGKIYATISLQDNIPGDLALINITGNVLKKQRVTGNGIYEVGTPNAAGVYVVSFVAGKRLHAKKIIIPE